ncbi:hypothetical protein MHOL44478_08755 [Mycobacterium holsaticum DSM 44478]|nr:hypothetical protein [Mycolicibacterium holsaticum DSM 44478 = JCM 12374]
MDYQPYEQLPDMLGSADVLLVLLEADASRFSVPSKILNYLCARRPVLALLPLENAAAHMLRDAEAGIVVVPEEAAGATSAMFRLLSDPELREQMAASGRQYAERTFDIRTIGDNFEKVIRFAFGQGDLLECDDEPDLTAEITSKRNLTESMSGQDKK